MYVNCASDIDECSRNRTLCGDEMYCENTEGSFECLCRPGFANITGNCESIQGNPVYDSPVTHSKYGILMPLFPSVCPFLYHSYKCLDFHGSQHECVSCMYKVYSSKGHPKEKNKLI